MSTLYGKLSKFILYFNLYFIYFLYFLRNTLITLDSSNNKSNVLFTYGLQFKDIDWTEEKYWLYYYKRE